jgi:uncharacterized protein (UPF0332 family)
MKQPEDVGNIKSLVKYRIESAQNDLRSAKALRDIDDYKGANNRAYYAVFHAITAVHGLNKKAYKRHKDAVSNFNKEYVKTEIFPRTMGRRIAELEEIRHASDYDDFYIASKEEVNEAIDTATEFVSMVEDYCNKEMNKW